MKMNAKIGFCFFISLGFLACSNDKDFPNTPVLTERNFSVEVHGKRAIWTIGFTDGDGDIGVRNDNDSDNFFVEIFSVINDTMTEFSKTTYRIPVVENIRTEKGIEGSFEFIIDIDLLRISSEPIDSAVYSGYVVDRSGNESNTVFTPAFSTKPN